MKNKQIFIHLGFPKTGSTYLQQYIFPEMKEALFLGKPFNRTIEILENKILQLDETQYQQEKKNLINSLEKIFNNSNNKYILSHEGFLRSTRYSSSENPTPNNIFHTLSRLNEIFSSYCQVNFILVIRKYDDMLRSYLTQFHHKFKFKYNKDDFLKDLRENEKKNNILRNFYYGEIIEYIEKFKINYKVLIYEDLNNKPELFHQQIFNFFDIHIVYKNEIIKASRNSSLKKKISILSNQLFDLYKRGVLLKKLFQYQSYFKLINFLIYKKNKFFHNQSFFKKYQNEIFNFYHEDFKKLPKNIKIRCDEYNYLKK